MYNTHSLYLEVTMRYPIAIEPGDATHSFGVVVPDLPGCFSAGETVDEAINNAKEAIEFWLEAVIDAGGSVPYPQSIESHMADPQFSGWIWALVSIEFSVLDEKRDRVNLSIPRRVLRRIDANAQAAHETRSGYLVRLALQDANRTIQASASARAAQAPSNTEKS